MSFLLTGGEHYRNPGARQKIRRTVGFSSLRVPRKCACADLARTLCAEALGHSHAIFVESVAHASPTPSAGSLGLLHGGRLPRSIERRLLQASIVASRRGLGHEPSLSQAGSRLVQSRSCRGLIHGAACKTFLPREISMAARSGAAPGWAAPRLHAKSGVISPVQSPPAATSCRTTAPAARRGAGGHSSPCREWSAPSCFPYRREAWVRNRHPRTCRR